MKARFDEESNIGWARKLEEYGVHVVYGLMGLKVHCKALLIVRKEGDVIRRYAHLSTGNYNSVTAQLYTDIGMLTCDHADWRRLHRPVQLPHRLLGQELSTASCWLRRSRCATASSELIEREIEHQKNGRGGHLIFKMNALVDQKMIELLYQASQAGVKVQLLVRGICCLLPGIAGVSDNITVTSIVGRFLEHSRIFYFRNGGDEEVYLGSADLMPRNLNRRVEVDLPGAGQKPDPLRARRDSGHLSQGTGQGAAHDVRRKVRARSRIPTRRMPSTARRYFWRARPSGRESSDRVFHHELTESTEFRKANSPQRHRDSYLSFLVDLWLRK